MLLSKLNAALYSIIGTAERASNSVCLVAIYNRLNRYLKEKRVNDLFLHAAEKRT